MSGQLDSSVSTLSLTHPNNSEDWDNSITMDSDTRNSVRFPAEDHDEEGAHRMAPGRPKRSLSELLRIHAQKGTDISFSAEEANRIAEVLGNWINAGSSPYEAEDDFFSRSQDDMDLPSTSRSSNACSRQRGKSEVTAPKS